jgi:hypothetical protein
MDLGYNALLDAMQRQRNDVYNTAIGIAGGIGQAIGGAVLEGINADRQKKMTDTQERARRMYADAATKVEEQISALDPNTVDVTAERSRILRQAYDQVDQVLEQGILGTDYQARGGMDDRSWETFRSQYLTPMKASYEEAGTKALAQQKALGATAEIRKYAVDVSRFVDDDLKALTVEIPQGPPLTDPAMITKSIRGRWDKYSAAVMGQLSPSEQASMFPVMEQYRQIYEEKAQGIITASNAPKITQSAAQQLDIESSRNIQELASQAVQIATGLAQSNVTSGMMPDDIYREQEEAIRAFLDDHRDDITGRLPDDQAATAMARLEDARQKATQAAIQQTQKAFAVRDASASEETARGSLAAGDTAGYIQGMRQSRQAFALAGVKIDDTEFDKKVRGDIVGVYRPALYQFATQGIFQDSMLRDMVMGKGADAISELNKAISTEQDPSKKTSLENLKVFVARLARDTEFLGDKGKEDLWAMVESDAKAYRVELRTKAEAVQLQASGPLAEAAARNSLRVSDVIPLRDVLDAPAQFGGESKYEHFLSMAKACEAYNSADGAGKALIDKQQKQVYSDFLLTLYGPWKGKGMSAYEAEAEADRLDLPAQMGGENWRQALSAIHGTNGLPNQQFEDLMKRVADASEAGPFNRAEIGDAMQRLTETRNRMIAESAAAKKPFNEEAAMKTLEAEWKKMQDARTANVVSQQIAPVKPGETVATATQAGAGKSFAYLRSADQAKADEGYLALLRASVGPTSSDQEKADIRAKMDTIMPIELKALPTPSRGDTKAASIAIPQSLGTNPVGSWVPAMTKDNGYVLRTAYDTRPSMYASQSTVDKRWYIAITPREEVINGKRERVWYVIDPAKKTGENLVPFMRVYTKP